MAMPIGRLGQGCSYLHGTSSRWATGSQRSGQGSQRGRGAACLAAFKRGSQASFLAEYGASVCVDGGCEMCGGMGGLDLAAGHWTWLFSWLSMYLKL